MGFAEFPYLGSALVACGVSLGLLAVAGPQRTMVLCSGLVGLPFLPTAVFWNGSYWNTQRLFGWPVGIEDALYVFAIGAGAWFFANLAGGPTQAAAPRPRLSWGRLGGVSAAALLGVWLSVPMGLPVVMVLYLIPAGCAGAILARHPAFRRPAVLGSLGCLLVAWLELRVSFWLWPRFQGDWVADVWTGWPVLGVPLGDLVWSALFGAAHPAVLLWSLERPNDRH